MLYIGPKDQAVNTGDAVLDDAWNERRALRLQHFDIGKKVQKLDEFIAEYERRRAPKPKPRVALCTCPPAVSGPGWASAGSTNPLCPVHGEFAGSTFSDQVAGDKT